jgi:multidrug resistance efflux pump
MPLAQMDPALLEAEKAVFAAQGRALAGELAAVTVELNHLEKLLERRLAVEQDLLALRVRQQTLLAEIEASETEKETGLLDLRIRNCTLYAQADGTVSRIYHTPGAVVAAGDPILSSVTAGPPYVAGFLSEYNARDVDTGMEAYLTPVSGRGTVIRAKVTALTPEIFTLPGRVSPVPAQTYRGRRVLLEPEAGCLLLPGEEVQIHFRRPWTFQLFGRLLQKDNAQ